jgi:hypothetical protein
MKLCLAESKGIEPSPATNQWRSFQDCVPPSVLLSINLKFLTSVLGTCTPTMHRGALAQFLV